MWYREHWLVVLLGSWDAVKSILDRIPPLTGGQRVEGCGATSMISGWSRFPWWCGCRKERVKMVTPEGNSTIRLPCAQTQPIQRRAWFSDTQRRLTIEA